MLKVSASYLEKQNKIFLKKYFLGRCQCRNKKAFFTAQFSVKVLVYTIMDMNQLWVTNSQKIKIEVAGFPRLLLTLV